VGQARVEEERGKGITNTRPIAAPSPSLPGKTQAMVFEVSSSGHRLGHVRLLLKALSERRLDTSIVFVLGDDFQGCLGDDLVISAQRLNSVRIVYMTPGETRRCQSHRSVSRRLNTYRVFERYLDLTSSTLGFVNYLDTILVGLAFPFLPGSDVAVAGILFRPSVHYRSLGLTDGDGASLSTQLKERLMRRLDDLIYRRALRNPRLCVALTLDPLFTEFANKHYALGKKVLTLAEPYSALRASSQSSSDGRKRFLMFGLITDRKGLLATLDALLLLSEADLDNTSLVVAGRIQKSIRSQALAKVENVRRRSPAVDIEIRDRFIPDQELEELIKACDVVLAPYRRHVGSSGVLAMAAHFRRAVISQRYGLMGALVERYRLGMTCDPERTEDLADCLKKVLHEDARNLVDPTKMAAYAASNGETLFIDSIFETLTKASCVGQRHGSGTAR
jgi:glycosyltransferase involved in cell wall biosynthesis